MIWLVFRWVGWLGAASGFCFGYQVFGFFGLFVSFGWLVKYYIIVAVNDTSIQAPLL